MLYVFEKIRAIYVQMPKCACTSIKWNLSLAEGLIDESAPYYWVSKQQNLKGNFQLPSDADSYFKFTFVRNPYDRLVSGWYDKIVVNQVEHVIEYAHPGVFTANMPFCDFVKTLDTIPDERTDCHFHSQTGLLRNFRLDYIGRFESFAEHWINVSEKLGISAHSAWHNARPRSHYRSYYNEETLEIATRRFQEDIATFGYLF